MKRLLSLLCLICVLFSTVACSSSLTVTETAENKTENVTAETEENKTDKIVYPEGFSVGYARRDITPTAFPIPIYDRDATDVHDPLYLTCTAVSDGEGAALLFSMDLKSCSRSLWEKSAGIIEKKFGIPVDRVFFNATHTHSAHDPGINNENVMRWQGKFYQMIPEIVEEALRDLDEAEAYVGKAYTDRLTFVRRYKLASGKFQTNPSASQADKPVAHESEADNELRTIRFDRKNKKDVLLVNYQTHYGGATGTYRGQISSDFVGNFRDSAEKELDVHFSYHSGASGNLNFNSAIPGEKKYESWIDANKEFMDVTRVALQNEEKVNVGKIRSSISYYQGTVLKDSPERVAQAQEVAAHPEDSEQYKDLLKKYNLSSKRWVNAIITRNNGMGEKSELVFIAISFGDIGFATAPYEMFDQNGKEVREGSPFKTTFICSMANGSNGYIPTTFAFPHGAYESMVTRFVQGSGEEFAGEMIRLLKECKNEA